MNPEHLVTQLAADQGGFVTRRQSRQLGMSDNQLQQRVATGQWTRLSGGYYRVLDLPGERNLLRAATSMLPEAVASHASASRLLGLSTAPKTKPMVLVHSQTTNRFPNVTVVRTHDLDVSHATVIDGIPATTAARTVLDLAAMLSTRRLRNVIDEVVAKSLATPSDVWDVLEAVARKGKPGIRRLRKTLEWMEDSPASPSVLEARAIRELTKVGLPSFTTEFPIPWSPEHRFDIAFPELKLAIELDSRRWHTRVQDFDKDRARDRSAQLRGWRVMRFTWTDVTRTPDIFTDQIREAVHLPTSS
jgi:hypothetical protein